MSFTTPADHTESDNDEPTDDNAHKPLLPSLSRKTNTTAISIPSSERKRSNNLIENKLNNLANVKLKRLNHRRSHREKWARLHIGILIVSFFIVIYFCFSIDLNIDKRAPQIVVDVPPIDDSLDGPRGNSIIYFPIVILLLPICIIIDPIVKNWEVNPKFLIEIFKMFCVTYV